MHEYPSESRAVPPASDISPAASASKGGIVRGLVWFVAGLSCLLLARGLILDFVEQYQYAANRGKQRAELEAAERGLELVPLEQLSKAYQLVSQRVGPSVVHISVASIVVSGTADEYESFFGFPRPRPESQGQGSGVVVDEAGYILTNNHVVAGATAIDVTLSDGRTVMGEVVGYDALTDLALLKVEADDLIAAEWGDSDALDVGALVWAVGSPFGLQHTITFGILSAKNRAAVMGNAFQDFLQTDAAVNPGNSGGPLVDARGHVIGINTAIVGQAYQGVSFAIPSAVARDVYERLKVSGRVERGWLGVRLGDVTTEAAREFDWPVSKGAYVHGVVNNPRDPSPAQRAGIQPGDIVIRWNNHEITDSTALSRMVAHTEIGSEAEAIIIRQGQEMTLIVEVAERPLQLN